MRQEPVIYVYLYCIHNVGRQTVCSRINIALIKKKVNEIHGNVPLGNISTEQIEWYVRIQLEGVQNLI